MTRSTIAQRLTLLTAVPVIALVLSSSMLVWDSLSRYQSAGQAHGIMEIAVASGDLIHPMQIERGTTAGFVQSGGQKFADTLPGVRAKTDEKLAAYRQLLGRTDTGSMPGLKKAIEEAGHKLDGMAKTREQATQLAIPAPEAAAFFTGAIRTLLEVMSTAAEYNKDPAIAKKLLTYHAFANAKENAGQERASTVPVFVANKVEPAQYRAILGKIFKQEAYMDTFSSSATEPERAALKSLLGGDAEKDVQRMRGIMAERVILGGFDVDPAVWFKRSTDRINGMHEIEQLLAKNINSDVNNLLSSSRTLLLMQLILAALGITIAVAVSVWVARGVNRPLKGVVDAIEYVVAQDDFTRGIPEEGTEETARVGQAVNHLREKFRSIISHVTRSSEGVAGASSMLVASSQQINRSSTSQSEDASSAAASIEELSVSISETAGNAQTAAEIVAKSRAGTAQVLATMAEAVKNVNGIAELIRESDANVGRLDDRSKKIGGIIQVIKEVADQTNLLALNAAIEAARAGEQGRGFAVVADEVRKLAERTSKATEEIASLIGDIQSHIGETVTGMRQANTQVAESLVLVGKTEAALHRIGDDSGEVANNVHSIADAIREQDSAIHQVVASVEKIAQMSEKNCAVTASSSDTATQLDRLADALKESVAHFKV
ncbi:MAG: methyl-accepting chemotaxis protein [Nitrosomonadales bacterium]|nr:methyl-accepting chemotaxis protein [Nitrosomonadales bacterium]